MSYNEELQSNNDALRDILDEVKSLPEGTGGVQADWNQSDPAARDFIKNRPFYRVQKWKCVAEPQTIETAKSDYFVTGEFGFYKAMPHFLYDDYPDGTVFKIIVGDDEYFGTYRAGAYIVGNGALVSPSGSQQALPDTGEDFLVYNWGADGFAVVTRKPLTECEVSVYMLEGEEIKKIDPQFLPDPVQDDWNQNDPAEPGYIKNRPFYRVQKWKCVQEPQVVDVFPADVSITGEMGAFGNYYNFLRNTYPIGTVFKLVIGGDSYTGTYKMRNSGATGYIGNAALIKSQWGPDTGEDFLLYDGGSMEALCIVTRKPLTECEVSVYMLEGEELVVDPQYASLLSGGSQPYVIDAEAYTYGDDALAAILAGRQIYVKVPSQTPGGLYANFMPVIQYQLPQSGNDYLTLIYLKDGIAQNIMAALQTGSFDAVYGQIVMLLSQSYDDCPLKVSPIK